MTTDEQSRAGRTWVESVPLPQAIGVVGGVVVLSSLFLKWEVRDGHQRSLLGVMVPEGWLVLVVLGVLGVVVLYRSFGPAIGIIGGGIFLLLGISPSRAPGG